MFGGQLLLYFYAFSFFMNVASAIMIWKIWRLKLAVDFTWSMLFMAVIVQLIRVGWSLFFLRDISDFVSTYPTAAVLTSYSLTSLTTIGIFIFAFNIYRGLKKILPPQIHG